MKLVRIPWREATKMFRLGAVALHCVGCQAEEQDEWYVDENHEGPYCSGCAAKLATAADSSRSVNRFYSNTTGTQVAVEHLEES